ncbi:unnamed protein product [Mucor hiemalis]
MDSITVRTTIIIKFAYLAVHNNNTSYDALGESSTSSSPTNAANKSCAVCGSRLHMTKHCPVHP